jgi:hypothetical protein
MAAFVFEGLSNIRGIQPIKTSAGMFMMVRILMNELEVSVLFLIWFSLRI